MKFSDDDRIKRVAFTGFSHMPLPQYVMFRMGKDLTYEGFNGAVSGLILGFGGKAYVHDVDDLNALLVQKFIKPVDVIKPDARIVVQDPVLDRKPEDPTKTQEWKEEYFGVLEYSVFGWFRYIPTDPREPNILLLRLTNNEAAYRTDSSLVGDRTLSIHLGMKDYIFTTYTLGSIDADFNSNMRQNIAFGSDLGIWTYVWFGYSWPLKVASGVVKFPDSD